MRHVCSLAVVLALGLIQPVAAGERGGATPPSLAGTWQVSVIYYYDGTLDGSTDKIQYLQHFDKDGRAVIFLPQNTAVDPFNESRTACVGEWKHRTSRMFDVTLYCLWQESWALAPSVPDRIRMKVSLDRDGRGWSATPFFYETFVDGAYVPTATPLSWGAMEGARLVVAPLP